MMQGIVVMILLTFVNRMSATHPEDNLVDELVDKLVGRVITGLSRGTPFTKPMLSIPRSPYTVPYSSLPVPRFSHIARAEEGSFYKKKEAEQSPAQTAQSAVAEARKAAEELKTIKDKPSVDKIVSSSEFQGNDMAMYEEDKELEPEQVGRSGAISQLLAGAAWTVVGTPLLFKLWSDSQSSKKSDFAQTLVASVYRKQLDEKAKDRAILGDAYGKKAINAPPSSMTEDFLTR
jgi:hypothetical protein